MAHPSLGVELHLVPRSVLEHLNNPFHRYDLSSRSFTHDEKKEMKVRISC